MRPLLLACNTSRKTLFRYLKHVRISAPSSGYSFIEAEDDEVQIRYCWMRDVMSTDSYTYIEPVNDTLMLNLLDLRRLYQYGGSIDLTKIKRIALTAFATSE